jgi:DNA-binding response OmpR family regulator
MVPFRSRACALSVVRALIVDDHRDSAVLLAAVLKFRIPELTVHVAHDGESGLQLAMAEKHDAVILDLALPGIGGADVAAEIRRRRQDATPLLIALSGSVAEIEHHQRTGDVFDHALTKPTNLDGLVDIMLQRGK